MRSLWYLAGLALAAPISLAAQQPASVGQPAAGYTVDFNHQDIRVVLSALAEAGGINVAFGKLPEVRVTLHLGQPVPKDQILDVMRGVAEQNGLTLTTQGPLVRIGAAPDRDGDTGPAGAGRPTVELYTYRLKYTSAAQLAPVLMSLFTGDMVGAAAAPRSGDNGRRDDRISSTIRALLDSGNGEGRVQRLTEMANGNRRAIAAINSLFNSNTQIPPEQIRDQADQLERMLRRGGSQEGARNAGGRVVEGLQSQIRIVPEEPTNTLLIRATPTEWDAVKKIIESVDLRPLQVLIEAVIVEVTRTKTLDVGVDATVTRTTPGQRVRSIKGDLPAVPNARDFLLQLAGGRGTIDFTAALNALATRGDLRVRSLPVIVGQNNKPALLNVGSSRPFVQVSQTVPNDPTGRVQTVQYIDVGTKLQITPRINAEGYVNLEVAQTANSATNEIQFDAPVLNRREATTQVFLKDGQTTVLGGLADVTRDYNRSGIPILRSLPIIGGLFGSTHRSDVETELYVFLTPHIISDDADIDRLRETLQQQSKELQQEPLKPMFDLPPKAPTP